MSPRAPALLLMFGTLALSPPSQAAVFQERTATETPLPPTGGQTTTILELAVPPGEYVASATASVVNGGPNDYARCALSIDGQVVNDSATLIGKTGGAPAAATLTNQSRIALSATRTVRLICGHDGDIPGQKVDGGASLVITEASGCGDVDPCESVPPAKPTIR